MKRGWYLGVLSLLLFVGWWASSAGTRGAHTAEIEASPSPVMAVASPQPGFMWQGMGSKVIEVGPIPAGTYVVAIVYPSTTDSNWFRVSVQGSKSERIYYWIAAGDSPINETLIFEVEETDSFTLFVQAVEYRVGWVITMTPVP